MVEYEFIEELSEKVKKFKQNPTPINGFKFPIEIARKKASEKELDVLKLIRERIHQNIPNRPELTQEEIISGILEWMKDTFDNDNFLSFESLMCQNESLFKNMEDNRINNDFRREYRNVESFFRLFRQMFISIWYIHDICKIAHNGLSSEHIYLDNCFLPKIGGFGQARESENELTGDQISRDLNDMGNLLRQLFFYLFGEELVANNEKLPLEVDRNHRVLAEDDYREIATRIINGLIDVNSTNADTKFEELLNLTISTYINPQAEFEMNVASLNLIV